MAELLLAILVTIIAAIIRGNGWPLYLDWLIECLLCSKVRTEIPVNTPIGRSCRPDVEFVLSLGDVRFWKR